MAATLKPNYVTTKDLVFTKSDNTYHGHLPNKENEKTFFICNNTNRTLHWDFAWERLDGLMMYPGSLSLQSLPSNCSIKGLPGKCFPIKPGETLEGLLTFHVEIDPRCEVECDGKGDGDSDGKAGTSRVELFKMGLKVYEQRSVDGLHINTSVDYPQQLLCWPIVVRHPLQGAHYTGNGRGGCLSLSIKVEFKSRPSWNYRTKLPQQFGSSRW